jgi:hypothetical protein
MPNINSVNMQCAADNTKGQQKSMPRMCQLWDISFTVLWDIYIPVAGTLCPPKWKGSLFSQYVPVLILMPKG